MTATDKTNATTRDVKVPTPATLPVTRVAQAPVAKASTKQIAKKPATPVKPATKVKPKVTVKPPVKTVAKPVVTAPVKASTPPVTTPMEKTVKAKKPKLVRDSFTIPKAEYTVLDDLKQRAGKLDKPVKKSELIRAGVKALAAMSDAAFVAALKAVPTIKTGRPSKH
jgi:hypothetical protein